MVGFHFTDSPPQDNLFQDFQTLNKFNDEQFTELVAIVFQFLSDRSKSDWLLEQITKFSSNHGVSASGLKSVIKSLIIIPNDALKRSLSVTQINEDLKNLGLDEDKVIAFSTKWNENVSTMMKASLAQTLSVNQLVDMDWKFGVTAVSSELNKVGNTFLQLKLSINSSNNESEKVFMEMSLPQFYSLLHEMEKAKASMEYLS